MSKNLGKSDLAFLEQGNIAFQNAEGNPIISEKLAGVGYDTAKMAEGKTLLDNAQVKYDNHQKDETAKSIAYQQYSDQEAQLKKLYSSHRKRAKIEFEDQNDIMLSLDLVKAMPTKYLPWLQGVKVFYRASLSSSVIKAGLATLLVLEEELISTQALIAPLEASYVAYKNSLGIAEESTKEKNDSFSILSTWMRKFYKVAGIALEDSPQLLESLGKAIRS